MRKSQFTMTRLYLTSSLSALLGLATFLTPTPKAHAACGTGEGGTLGVDNLGPVHIGDTITVNLVDLANLPTSFKATNFNTFVVFPDNSARQANSIPFIQAGATCAAGGSPFDLQCPGGGANCVSFVNAYVVSFADVGRNLTFSRTVGNFTAVCNSGGIPNFIQFEEAGAGAAISGGTATDTAGTPVGAASVCQTLQVLVIFPCITITKDCDNACTPYGQPIFFHGTVSNTGDTPLVNVVVTDTPPAGSTESAITFENVQPSNRVWDGTLAPGESAVYHGSYTPPSTGGASLCGPFTDTISATAVDISGTPLDNTTPCINPTTGVSTGTRPPVTATCLVCNNPCVQVTKNCGPPIIDLATGSYTVSGLVTNCGNVPLVNVVVTDTITNGNGVVSTVTIPLGNLDIGASVAIPPQTISLTVCGPSSDFFTATAAGQCGGLLTNVSATCVTLVTNTACIQVSKVCGPATIDLAAGSYTVSGSVTNCGTADLSNVVVTDTITNANGTVDTITINIGTVPAHTAVPIPAQTINLTTCGTISDFFSATGTGPCGPASATSATCATVVTNAACVQVIKDCGPALLDLASGSYTVSGSVSNCSSAPLTGVVVTDTITNSSGVVFTVPINIGTVPAHTAVPIPAQTITVTNCGPSSDFFTVTGEGPCGPTSNTSGTCVTLVTNTACIQVSKVCGPATIDLSAGSYTVSGSVTNCGTADLTGVVVTDTITNANGTVDTITITIGTIAAHTAVAIPAQTINLTSCGTISDFFTATGTGPCGPASATSGTCVTLVANTACIGITKVCGPGPTVGIDLSSGSYTVSGLVTNCGATPLTDVVVVDTITNANGFVSTVTIPIGTIPAHGSAVVPTQTITVTNCGPSSDFFTVTGTGPCGPTSATSGTCVTLVTNAACIGVSKACGPATIDVAAGSYTVSGTVTNCGSAALTGVVVTDTITNANGTVDTITITIGTVPAHSAVPIPAQTINLTTCGTISDFFTATGNGPCGPASATSATCVTLVGNTACIQVSKVCGPATIDLAAGSYTVSGSVTNCGSADITGVVVTDTITNANGTVDTITINIGTVPAHTAVPIPAQTINLTTCGTVSDFFTATGNGPCGPTSATSATCVTVVTNTACIQVGKVCGPATINLSAGSFQVSGSVTNCGTAPLTGVTILDVVTAPNGTITTNVVSSGGTLPAGASAAIGPITIPVTLCGPYTDYLIAIGAGPCGSITNRSPQTCTTTVLCPVPCISVNKGIACAPATGGVCDGTLTYGETASGVVGPTNQTAFCYQLIVANCDVPGGANSEPLVVTNIHDNLISPLAGFETPFTLQPGESRTNYYKQSYGAGTHVNTVTAIGSGQASGVVTNAQDSTTATVVPISVACDLHLTNDFQVNTTGPVDGCDVQLGAGSGNSATLVTLTIHNTGQGDLNVSVVGGSILSTTPLVDCGSGASIAPPVVFVPAGQTVVTNIGCVTVSCPAGATISATVQGTAVASASIPCVFDTAGHAITTAPSSCQNCVKCEQGAGCTPGFWKNCTQQWLNTGFSTGQPVSSVFTVPSCVGNLGSATLLEALSFKGGSGVSGAAQILLRAAVAGVLNSAKIQYPLTTAQVISMVNTALASCDRATILTLASTLDGLNNLGCRDRNGNGLPCHATTPVSALAVEQQH